MTIIEALHLPGLDPVDARVLLQHVTGVSHAALITHADRPLQSLEREQFLELAARRLRGEPVAYLIGWREFYGRRFGVSPAVLIPRPETELLVDLALSRLSADRAASVLDLGTGSGNLAITLALERPLWSVTAVDASAGALAVARANARELAASPIEWLQGDWYGALTGRSFDLIVANPPYVADADPHLRCGDLRFEPSSALRAGRDGLAAIRQIVAEALSHLEPDGWLLIEHGCDQADACRRLLADAGFTEIATAPDLAQLPRVSGGRRAA